MRVTELYRRTYWRSFFSRRSRIMLERCQLSMGRMMRRRYGCWYHEEALRKIRLNRPT